ncbi:hypothetical protein ABFS82_10G129900 [Erythranthe guttata]
MDSRRNIPPPPPQYDEHIRRASGIMHRVPHHPMEPLPSPVQLENQLEFQVAEIERLTGDNRKLASGHLSLREELGAAEQEVEKGREHIRSTQNEGDIQIRILLDKIAKMEADIRNGSSIKKELQEAHNEKRGLVKERLELTNKIQLATKELDNSRADVKKIPEMRAELDSLTEEHQRLRKTFEHEKGVNTEKVEQMKTLEKDLIGLSAEVEKLRAEVLNAEMRAKAPIPYSGQYVNTGNIYPPPYYGYGGYPESFSVPHFYPYAVGGFSVEPQVFGGPLVSGNATSGGGFSVIPPQVISGDATSSGGFTVAPPQVIGGDAGGGFAVAPPQVVGVDAAGNVWGGVYDKSGAPQM